MRRFRLATSHKKRRIRKKWRIGEYTMWGFEVWTDALSAEAVEKTMEALIDLAEARGRCLGGGSNPDHEILVFVDDPGRGACTEADRVAFMERLKAPDLSVFLANSEVMPLEDAWA